MTELHSLSQSLYVGLCQEVGTREVVKMRRDILDINEEIQNNRRPYYDDTRRMESGSYREGFRLKGSDRDTMFWPNSQKVIYDPSQSEKYYNLPFKQLIFMECERSPPGFALLRLLPTSNNTFCTTQEVLISCVIMNDELYISSTLFREKMCSVYNPNSSVHGPCSNGFILGLEYDTAHCFKCDFWPRSALPMKQRCQTWLTPLVIQDILNNGCHLVAKGSPVSHYEDKEWRISFSQAEKKLVYRMNHCQFLVYGLLKLFLKEVINQGVVDKLLCSYFMKTVVFWEIVENKLPAWRPKTVVQCFWSCFKHIINWVYRGECPNFFIPQNNMFSAKIVGSSQQNLFRQLYGLYEQGYTCLLLSPSIRSHIVQVLYKPNVVVNVTEEHIISEVDFDKALYCEVYQKDIFDTRNLHTCMKYLHTVELFIIQIPLTPNHLILLQKLTFSIFQRIAFHLHNRCRDRVSNKMMYIVDRISCHMLKLAAKFGLITDMVYIAIYYYRTCRYTEALSVIEMTKAKLSQPYVMHCSDRVNKERYIGAVGGLSWSTKMRVAVAWNIKLHNNVCFINELRLEQHISGRNSLPLLQIPPHIMLHMLSVLCYSHVDTMKRQQALDNLLVLLHHDDGMYVPVALRDISYQILGLCQEVCGDKLGSLHSYQESLRQFPWHKIQRATEIRIDKVKEQLNR